ncbi:hypothetical protein [Paenibacillus agaridevorans]|uniref:hypothetical protein n=1 Tax=Paenibacillus agaridevorans TaxID=171404 RepID=UPI001BE49266|nr:hypothetical protein [Paenibacillus agaridevorans]
MDRIKPENQNNDCNSRLFLRKKNAYEVGQTLEDLIVDENNKISLYHLIGDGSFLALLSTGCEPCLHWLNQLGDMKPGAPVILLIECEEDEKNIIDKVMGEKYSIFRVPLQKISTGLRAPSIPWVYYVDGNKQIKICEPADPYFSFINHFDRLEKLDRIRKLQS